MSAEQAARALILAQDQLRLLALAERFGMDVEVTVTDAANVADAKRLYEQARRERP